MIREDILGGLKSGLSRGESLKQAMMTLYNAGYKKEEIEAATRILQVQEYQTGQIYNPLKFKRKISKIKKVQPKARVIQRVSDYNQKPQGQIQRLNIQSKKSIRQIKQITKKFQQQTKRPKLIKPVQKISGYGNKAKKPKGKIIIFILIFILLILLGILASIFLFKNEFMEFLNNIF